MNKHKLKIYAEALADFFEYPEKDDKKIVDNFLKILSKNRDIKKLEKIIDIATAIYLKRKGKKMIVIETARENKNAFNEIVLKGDVVVRKINPELIAGARITVNKEKQFDASLSSKLEKLCLTK